MAAKKKPAPKRGASRYQAPAKQPIPGWLWMAIGLAVGAFVVILMKLEPGKGDDVKRVKQEQQKASQTAQANKTPPSPTQPAKPKYDFYTLLPESEVIVPPEAVPEKLAVALQDLKTNADNYFSRGQAFIDGHGVPRLIDFILKDNKPEQEELTDENS